MAFTKKHGIHRTKLTMFYAANVLDKKFKKQETIPADLDIESHCKFCAVWITVGSEESSKLKILRESNQTRKFYQGITKRRNNYTPSTLLCSDKSGKLITEKQEVLKNLFFSIIPNEN
uniref:Uncharacterized protein n=1 Tax=Megaselia scalaris TaxID=36166 RepID=T1GVJ9_MEGSC